MQSKTTQVVDEKEKLQNEDGTKYQFKITDREGKSVIVDVYDVLEGLDIRCPAMQQLVKKALFTGKRGVKSVNQDFHGIQSCLNRAKELHYLRVQKFYNQKIASKTEILETVNPNAELTLKEQIDFANRVSKKTLTTK